jgi:hypothetical protein
VDVFHGFGALAYLWRMVIGLGVMRGSAFDLGRVRSLRIVAAYVDGDEEGAELAEALRQATSPERDRA